MKQLPPNGNSHSAADVAKRRQWLAGHSRYLAADLPPDAPEQLKGLIENQIGNINLPLAVAGPLKIKGDFADGVFYAPLCTLEGTLALSMTRGLYLTYLSGGIKTRHLGQRLNRSPAFILNDTAEALAFGKWADDHLPQIRAAAESKSKHGKLLRMEKIPIHKNMILNFVFSTGDAAGQNMVTICTHAACQYIRDNYPKPVSFLIESNYAGDKNASWNNLITGRGHHIIAECRLRNRHIKRVLHTDVRKMTGYRNVFGVASYLGGVLGLNAHAANALAALYLATGQDVACVAENCNCISEYEVDENGDLLVSLQMPSATIGTVGGATRLPQQRANLELLGCTGTGSAAKFAEIVCACVLALEISLLGAIASDEFTRAHATFGR